MRSWYLFQRNIQFIEKANIILNTSNETVEISLLARKLRSGAEFPYLGILGK